LTRAVRDVYHAAHQEVWNVGEDKLRIIGIDPGTLICGYGVLEQDRQGLHVLDYGVVRARKGELPERLGIIHTGLCSIFARYKPDVAAVEGAFFGKNVRTALKIGEARGMVIVAAVAAGAKVFEYAPATVKKSVVGTGRADKQQVQQMVRLILNLPEPPEPADAADALALAICHAHRTQAGE
jgi:crossover junction endodeoxyribonuclease RuvC